MCEIDDRDDETTMPTWRQELRVRGHHVGEAFLDDRGRLVVMIDDAPRSSQTIRRLLRRAAH